MKPILLGLRKRRHSSLRPTAISLLMGAIAIGLSACSGGSSSSDSSQGPPRFTGPDSVTIEENVDLAINVQATDPDGDRLTFSVAPGRDGDLFSIAPGSSVLRADALDYERPEDGDEDNEYVVTVRVSDGPSTITRDYRITITNVDDTAFETVGAIALTGSNRDDDASFVSAIGDINGDGMVDFAIGAPGFDGDTGQDQGAIYVVSGDSFRNSEASVISLSQSRPVLLGLGAGAAAGAALSLYADLDADTFPELVVTAPGAFVEDSDIQGIVYVVRGAALRNNFSNQTSLDLGTAIAANRVVPVYNENPASALSGMGLFPDIDGDGVSELLICSPSAEVAGNSQAGRTYLVFSEAIERALRPGSTQGPIDLARLSDDGSGIRINGVDAGDRSCSAAVSAGDFDGDGRADLLIGAPGADGGAGDDNAGEVYLVRGSALGNARNGQIELSTLVDDNAGAVLSGVSSVAADFSNVGSSLTSLGDVNGDGLADVLISGRDPSTPDRSNAFLVFGQRLEGAASVRRISLPELAQRSDLIVLLSEPRNSAALSDFDFLDPSVDIDVDGILDAVFSIDIAGDLGQPQDSAYVLFGGIQLSNPGTIDLNRIPSDASIEGIRVKSANPRNLLRLQSSYVGDLDNDGRPDLVIGETNASATSQGLSNAGRIVILTGKLIANTRTTGDRTIQIGELFPELPD